MKSIITLVLSFLLIITVTVLIRANTVFEDKQLSPGHLSHEIDIDRQAAVSRLTEAIKIPTISYDDRSQIDYAGFIRFHQLLERFYPLIHQQMSKTVINGHSLIYHLPGSQTDASVLPILFMAHIDVVPIDGNTRGKWQHDPFGGVVSGGVIFGRGTMDDKSGLMALMESFESMLSQGKRPNRDIYLAFGHDEEIGGKQGAAKIAQYFADNNIHFEFVLDEGGAITEGMMQGIDPPVALIGIAEKGYVNLHLTVEGDGGHSSQPPKHTALGIISQAIVKLEQNPFEPSLQFTQRTFDAIGNEAQFATKAIMSNLWLTAPLVKSVVMSQPKLAASFHTTMAATMASASDKSNVLPTKAEAVVNARIFPGQNIETVTQYVKEVIDDERVKVHTSMGVDPSPVSSTDSNGYKLVAQSIRDLDNQVIVAPYLVQGGTDSKYFYAVADDVYRFLPFRATAQTLKRLHGIDEQITIDDYINTIRFYSQIISKI